MINGIVIGFAIWSILIIFSVFYTLLITPEQYYSKLKFNYGRVSFMFVIIVGWGATIGWLLS